MGTYCSPNSELCVWSPPTLSSPALNLLPCLEPPPLPWTSSPGWVHRKCTNKGARQAERNVIYCNNDSDTLSRSPYVYNCNLFTACKLLLMSSCGIRHANLLSSKLSPSFKRNSKIQHRGPGFLGQYYSTVSVETNVIHLRIKDSSPLRYLCPKCCLPLSWCPLLVSAVLAVTECSWHSLVCWWSAWVCFWQR